MIRLISIFVIAALCFPGISGAVGRQTPEPIVGSACAAQDTALEDAQLTAGQVSDIRTEYEIDDGRAEYEVEFRDGDWEYEYTVDANTGTIVDRDKDYDPPAAEMPAPEPVSEPVPEPAPEVPVSDRLTAEEATAIALAHAGVAEADAKRLRTEFDMDDGVAEWEVEFRVGAWEYEYEINANTGAILSWERDDD